MRQGIIVCHRFLCKSSNAIEPILNPEDVTFPPNESTLARVKSQIHPENTVTKRLQPIDLLNEKEYITFCAAIIILSNEAVNIHNNSFTDQSYKLEKGLHIANVLVLTTEQMEHVKPVHPVST